MYESTKSKGKKYTLIKSKEKGGLDTADFTLFDKALKVCWVRRLCSEGFPRMKSCTAYLMIGLRNVQP